MHKKPQNPNTPATPANDSDLYQSAFDNAVQASFIATLRNGKIINANKFAHKLLGYSKAELIAKSFSSIFNTRQSTYKKMISQRVTDGKAVAIIRVLKKGGTEFTCEFNSTIFTDAGGIKRTMSTMVDISQSLLRQQNIDDKKDKIVAYNIVLAKSDQQKIDAKNKKTVGDNILLAKAKQKKIDVKKEKIVSQNIILAKSKQKKIDIEQEKAVADNIIAALAKSSGEKLVYEEYGRQKVLIEIEENFHMMFNASSDVLFDANLVLNKIIVNDSYEKEFGHLKNSMLLAEDWSLHIHSDDKNAVMKSYRRMLKSKDIEWKCGYRFLKLDNTIANILSSHIILRDEDGKVYRMIGTMQDISKQKVLEERLENEIKLKEIQIAEAAEDAKHSERSDIGKELHDNVNQLLGASKMYLEMAKRGGENSEMYFSRSSEYTLMAIEEIQKLTKGLTTDIIKNLGLCEAIESIVHDTMEISPVKIHCSIKNFKEGSVNDKFKLNIYRIVQEQLNNILKHARATTVEISLLQNKKSIELRISDNGIGFDTEKKRNGIGLSNIRSRSESYHGTADIVSGPGKGCILTATFSAADSLLQRA